MIMLTIPSRHWFRQTLTRSKMAIDSWLEMQNSFELRQNFLHETIVIENSNYYGFMNLERKRRITVNLIGRTQAGNFRSVLTQFIVPLF